MVELTVEKVLLFSIGLILALLVGIPLIINILDIIRITISGIG